MIMLIPQLQKNIQDKWDDCWPISSLKPLAILDLISYVFFIKKLDDRELISKNLQGMQGTDFVITKEVEEFTWSRLRNMDAQRIHDLFTRQHGIIDLMAQYANSDFLFSDYFKAPLLLTPTPKLLFKVIEVINLIESSDKNTQAAIVDYLFNKAEIAGQNGQVFIPGSIAWLMVALAEPTTKDVILDPSAGNGALMVNAAAYVAKSNNLPVNRFQNGTPVGIIKGMESDLMQLRLAGMNMMLHGISNSGVEILDITATGAAKVPGKPTLIISNLFLKEVEGTMRVEGNTLKSDKSEKEIVLLNLILENLGPGGRAVIIIPEYLLNNIAPEIKKIRQDIINNYRLEGVIYLPPKSNSLFSGAGILIFNKHESLTTADVWFCKMKSGKEDKKKEQSSYNGSENGFFTSSEFYDVTDILNQWRNRESTQINNAGDSFYLSAYDIKDNDYNLNLNDYKINQKSRELHNKIENIDEKTDPLVATKKEHLHHFFEDSVPLYEKKRRRKTAPLVILLLILISGTAGFYFFYNQDNKKNNTPRLATVPKRSDSASAINVGNTSVPLTGTNKSNKPVIAGKDEQEPPKDDPQSPKDESKFPKDEPRSPTSELTAVTDQPRPSKEGLNPANKSQAFKNEPETSKVESKFSVVEPEPSVDGTIQNIPAGSENVSKDYTVITKAYFYSEPDIRKPKSLYLEPRQNLVLEPTKDQNGFVYVIYINKKGQTTRGWLNKKDLQPVE